MGIVFAQPEPIGLMQAAADSKVAYETSKEERDYAFRRDQAQAALNEQAQRTALARQAQAQNAYEFEAQRQVSPREMFAAQRQEAMQQQQFAQQMSAREVEFTRSEQMRLSNLQRQADFIEAEWSKGAYTDVERREALAQLHHVMGPLEAKRRTAQAQTQELQLAAAQRQAQQVAAGQQAILSGNFQAHINQNIVSLPDPNNPGQTLAWQLNPTTGMAEPFVHPDTVRREAMAQQAILDQRKVQDELTKARTRFENQVRNEILDAERQTRTARSIPGRENEPPKVPAWMEGLRAPNSPQAVAQQEIARRLNEHMNETYPGWQQTLRRQQPGAVAGGGMQAGEPPAPDVAGGAPAINPDLPAPLTIPVANDSRYTTMMQGLDELQARADRVGDAHAPNIFERSRAALGIGDPNPLHARLREERRRAAVQAAKDDIAEARRMLRDYAGRQMSQEDTARFEAIMQRLRQLPGRSVNSEGARPSSDPSSYAPIGG